MQQIPEIMALERVWKTGCKSGGRSQCKNKEETTNILPHTVSQQRKATLDHFQCVMNGAFGDVLPKRFRNVIDSDTIYKILKPKTPLSTVLREDLVRVRNGMKDKVLKIFDRMMKEERQFLSKFHTKQEIDRNLIDNLSYIKSQPVREANPSKRQKYPLDIYIPIRPVNTLELD